MVSASGVLAAAGPPCPAAPPRHRPVALPPCPTHQPPSHTHAPSQPRHPQVAGETVSLMVPCADMANHVLAPNAAYQFVPEADAFQLTALRVRDHLARGDCLATVLAATGWFCHPGKAAAGHGARVAATLAPLHGSTQGAGSACWRRGKRARAAAAARHQPHTRSAAALEAQQALFNRLLNEVPGCPAPPLPAGRLHGRRGLHQLRRHAQGQRSDDARLRLCHPWQRQRPRTLLGRWVPGGGLRSSRGKAG